MKELRPAVHHQIKQYEISSKSKSLFRLKKKNEDRIIRAILKKRKEKPILELILKRDRLDRKINELLNEVAEQTSPSEITDFDEAKSYLEHYLLKEHEKSDQILSLIEKHRRFQISATDRRDKIIEEYRPSSTKRFLGLSKLDQMEKQENSRKEGDFQQKLKSHYETVADSQRKLSVESEAMLRQLGVPFFAIEEDKVQMDSTEMKNLKSRILKHLMNMLK